jgi:hypothetical protein
VPSGYYTSFYGGYPSHVPRHGVYGWAGGSWGHFDEWVFCPTRYFGRPHYQRYFRSGREVARHATYRDLPRGVIATDTRSLRRDVWGQPEAIQARLATSRSRLAEGGTLPDVTDFVARRREVRPEVAEIIKPLPAESRRQTPAPAAVRRTARSARSADERSAAFERIERGRAGVAPGADSFSQRDRGEITVRSRSRFETRGGGDLRVYERTPLGRPSFDSTGPGSERRAVDRDGRDSLDRASDGTLRTLPPRVEEPPVVQRVLDQVRGRQSAPPPVREDRGSSSVRSEPRERSSGSDARARSSSSDRRETSARSSSSSSSRSDSGRSRARQRTSSDRKPPAD